MWGDIWWPTYAVLDVYHCSSAGTQKGRSTEVMRPRSSCGCGCGEGGSEGLGCDPRARSAVADPLHTNADGAAGAGGEGGGDGGESLNVRALVDASLSSCSELGDRARRTAAGGPCWVTLDCRGYPCPTRGRCGRVGPYPCPGICGSESSCRCGPCGLGQGPCSRLAASFSLSLSVLR